MTSAFSIRTTPRYERTTRRLLKAHANLRAVQNEAWEILQRDPHNRSRRHPIKKLTGVSQGEGQYRLRLRRWRFRYDIYGREVVLQHCGLRREDTYR